MCYHSSGTHIHIVSISSRYFPSYQLQTLKTTLGHFILYVKMPPTSKTQFKLGAFLNFQELFPKSIERDPESHSIRLCRRLQGVFMGGY